MRLWFLTTGGGGRRRGWAAAMSHWHPVSPGRALRHRRPRQWTSVCVQHGRSVRQDHRARQSEAASHSNNQRRKHCCHGLEGQFHQNLRHQRPSGQRLILLSCSGNFPSLVQSDLGYCAEIRHMPWGTQRARWPILAKQLNRPWILLHFTIFLFLQSVKNFLKQHLALFAHRSLRGERNSSRTCSSLPAASPLCPTETSSCRTWRNTQWASTPVTANFSPISATLLATFPRITRKWRVRRNSTVHPTCTSIPMITSSFPTAGITRWKSTPPVVNSPASSTGSARRKETWNTPMASLQTSRATSW